MTPEQLAERVRRAEAIRAAATPYLSADALAVHLDRAQVLSRRFAFSLRAAGVCPHRDFVDNDSGPARVTCGRCPSLDLFGVVASETFSCHEHAEGGE